MYPSDGVFGYFSMKQDEIFGKHHLTESVVNNSDDKYLVID